MMREYVPETSEVNKSVTEEINVTPKLNPRIDIKFTEDQRNRHEDENFKTYETNTGPMSGQGKFPCTICKKVFTQSPTMRRHVKMVHEGLRYQCSICEYSSSSKQYLKVH